MTYLSNIIIIYLLNVTVKYMILLLFTKYSERKHLMYFKCPVVRGRMQVYKFNRFIWVFSRDKYTGSQSYPRPIHLHKQGSKLENKENTKDKTWKPTRHKTPGKHANHGLRQTGVHNQWTERIRMEM